MLNRIKDAGVAQWLEFLPSKQAVEGSNPFARSINWELCELCIYETNNFTYKSFPFLFIYDFNARTDIYIQLSCPYGSGVEHFLGKEEVVSSSLTMGSTLHDGMDKSITSL